MLPLHQRVVYGPIRSRRLGRSLGINLLPRTAKICSFNCPYCQYGWTQMPKSRNRGSAGWPTATSVASEVAAWLRHARARGDRIDRLTLAGHGEPTLHPEFEAIVAALRPVRDELAPGTPLAVLSNASTLGRAAVRTALAQIDERYMKLDAGSDATLRRLNGSLIPVARIVAGLRRLPDVIIQTMFVTDRLGQIDNTSDEAVDDWVGALRQIRPRAVHLYTLDRPPAWPFLCGVSGARLDELAQRVRAAGFVALVFPPAP